LKKAGILIKSFIITGLEGKTVMRSAVSALLLIAVLLLIATGQTALDKTLESQLKRVFPTATAFSAKQSSPVPHYVAYTGNPGSQTIAGYAFWTTELEPLERGYDGPIKILVGLDLNAHLTGVLVTENHEPYGYFSVDPPEFAAQFKGKDIRDPFKVGGDVAAVSRASISVNSSSRSIRNGARRVARAMLTPGGTAK
jgi:transcriptional regulator of nitric oxide reductase